MRIAVHVLLQLQPPNFTWNSWGTPGTNVPVWVIIFEISTSYSLKEALGKLHITDVFSNHADLSGITEQTQLKLSKASHKAVVNIDERGTTASAATTLVGVPLSWSPPTVFNHPFLVLIIETKTNNILFLGSIANPKEH
uniref:Serpin domain-containing protein n=1 Tax=Salvator merianae TaxID=96440 RepID=A0A8D0BYA5_SALMN